MKQTGGANNKSTAGLCQQVACVRSLLSVTLVLIIMVKNATEYQAAA